MNCNWVSSSLPFSSLGIWAYRLNIFITYINLPFMVYLFYLSTKIYCIDWKNIKKAYTNLIIFKYSLSHSFILYLLFHYCFKAMSQLICLAILRLMRLGGPHALTSWVSWLWVITTMADHFKIFKANCTFQFI